MKVTIVIEAETIADLYTHTVVIGKEIKKRCRKLRLTPIDDEFPVGTEWADSNCYGDHFLTVEKEDAHD